MDAKSNVRSDPAEQKLISLAQGGDAEAEAALIAEFAPLVRICTRPYFLQGGDNEDLIQEGMLGLLSAIRHYSSGRGASFRTFAELCIRRRVFSAIKRYSAIETIDLPVEVPQTNPETILIDREMSEEFLNGFLEQLSSLERQILDLYLKGLSYREISSGTGKSAKSVDNAIQRVRRKLTQFKLGDTSSG